MRRSRNFLNLSIFTRSLLLMIVALAIAESIAIALILKRPPIHNRPVALTDIVRELDREKANAPESHRDDFQRGGPAGDGPPPREPNSSNFGPEKPPKPQNKLPTYTTANAPIEPNNIDRSSSELTQKRLATLLGANPNSLRVYLPKDDGFFRGPPSFDNSELTEGFLVAKQQDDDSWLIIEDIKQSFPNEFHKQALILFCVGAFILLPIAWLFSLSLAHPIAKFSQAAKRLGTDPNAPPLAVEGPSEMLLAIESFNSMQERLNSLLRERTDMIAAIAHDLRTPLTRLAFRLDDLPSPLNEKVSADIQEMKSMISLALDFIRDRSQTSQRERLDFRLLVESVVDDQCDIGQDVILEKGPSITLEGDPLALRRAVMNVVDNAIKYGARAIAIKHHR